MSTSRLLCRRAKVRWARGHLKRPARLNHCISKADHHPTKDKMTHEN